MAPGSWVRWRQGWRQGRGLDGARDGATQEGMDAFPPIVNLYRNNTACYDYRDR